MKKIIITIFASALAGMASVNVFAADTTTATTSTGLPSWTTFVIFGVMLVAMYFLMIRPQKKQEKENENMRNSLKVGDEIVTIGGIIGTVVIVKDDKLMIETGNDKTKLTILRSSVKTILGN